jgi:hypothetical protein
LQCPRTRGTCPQGRRGGGSCSVLPRLPSAAQGAPPCGLPGAQSPGSAHVQQQCTVNAPTSGRR